MLAVTSPSLSELREKIIALADARNDIISGLDKAFCLPDAAWHLDADNTLMNSCYHKFRCYGIDSVASVLRPLSWNFTGYNDILYEIDRWVAKWEKDTFDLSDRHLVRPLPLPGEKGPVIRDVIVNHDTSVYQERINLMRISGVLDKLDRNPDATILEIGGGYGALALAILNMYPNARYVICDLPESLLFSGLYLALAGKTVEVSSNHVEFPIKPGVTLVPNYLFHLLRDSTLHVDLAINTLSMCEMSKYQVKVYAQGISRLIGTDGVFFEQNMDNSERLVGRAIRRLFLRRADGSPLMTNYPKHHLWEWFSHYETIVAPEMEITQGEPHLWTN
jgi:O-methyltransferase domain